VRALDELSVPDLPKPDPRMLDIAGKIIEQQAGNFDPSEFQDRALRAVIEEKKKGRPVRPSQDVERDETVVDLMEALKRAARRRRDGHAAQTAGAMGVDRKSPQPDGAS
jgi:DNA end-binding protein Ku